METELGNGGENRGPVTKTSNFSIAIKIILGIVVIASVVYVFLADIDVGDEKAVEQNSIGIEELDKNASSKEAISSFESALDSSTDTENKITILINLAFAYEAEGENEKAIEKYKEALTYLKPESFQYDFLNGNIDFLEGDCLNASINLNKAYKKNSEDFQLNGSLGLFYLDLDESCPEYYDPYKALVFNEKAVELAPELDVPKENLGINYLYVGDYEKAIETINQTNITEDDYINLDLGVAHIYNGDEELGLSYIQKVIDSGQEIPDWVYEIIEEL